MKSILLVDDDPDLRDAAYEALESAGYHVIEAPAIARAQDLLERVRPSLLLVDLETADAAQFPAWVAAQPSLSTVPLLAMTSFEFARTPPRVSALLRKPFSLDELLAAVAALVDPAR